MAPTKSYAVECHDASFEYVQSGRSLLALQNVDVSIAVGEFVSIVGPSGCGKSTLVRLLGGLAEPTSGTLETVAHAGRHEGRVSMMFQSPILVPWRDAIGNVMLIDELRRRPSLNPTERRARAERMLDLVGLRDFATALPGQLSGGMQQRASLARALMADPELLLLDEPFGALDALTRQQLNLELQRVWMRRPTTVVLVTHDIGEAIMLSDRVLVMSSRPGEVVAEVPVRLERPRDVTVQYTDEARQLTERVMAGLGQAPHVDAHDEYVPADGSSSGAGADV